MWWCLWLPKLVGWWLTLSRFYHKVTWLIGYVVLLDHLTKSYFHSYSTYDHQIWQGGDLPWRSLIIVFTWDISHVSCLIMWQTKNIPLLIQYLWSQNLARWWHTMKSCNSKVTYPSILWSCEVTWHIRYFLSPLSLDQWPLNMTHYEEFSPTISYNYLNISFKWGCLAN